jgi:hypothetical protein
VQHTLKGRQDAAVDRVGLRLALRKAQAEAGDIMLLFADESEALTHPYLARSDQSLGQVSGVRTGQEGRHHGSRDVKVSLFEAAGCCKGPDAFKSENVRTLNLVLPPRTPHPRMRRT